MHKLYARIISVSPYAHRIRNTNIFRLVYGQISPLVQQSLAEWAILRGVTETDSESTLGVAEFYNVRKVSSVRWKCCVVLFYT